MYFPYLRGKQFELIALRELSSRLGRSGEISPVIEPVKESLASLEKCISSLVTSNVNFNLILNPIVGEMVNKNSQIINFVKKKLMQYDNFQIGIIITQTTLLDYIDKFLADLKMDKPITLIHIERPNDLNSLSKWCSNKQIRYNLFGENIQTRRYRNVIDVQTKVLLEDNFRSLPRNVDYKNQTDEFFSDEHLFYLEDGFIGFADYLTNGAGYQESGFLPYAVAIHFTYIKNKDKSIWIRHFVSDSNTDNIDVAGKYGEALEKLIPFIDKNDIETDAANEFRYHYEQGKYPGLGSIKKLSIKNHIELLLQLLG